MMRIVWQDCVEVFGRARGPNRQLLVSVTLLGGWLAAVFFAHAFRPVDGLVIQGESSSQEGYAPFRVGTCWVSLPANAAGWKWLACEARG
ncbi:MAG: hypothetical protein ACYS8I_00445 [Planctomycetota bacterium]